MQMRHAGQQIVLAVAETAPTFPYEFYIQNIQ